MRVLLILVLILFSGHGFAEYKTQRQVIIEREMAKEYRMQQELMRELRDTGQIAPKDYIDIYNMQEGGYGYDGGPRGYQPYRYRYRTDSY